MERESSGAFNINLDKVVAKMSNIKSLDDLTGPGGPIQELLKQAVESLLKGEQEAHLGYERYNKGENGPKNSRNGYSSKTLKTKAGPIEIAVPRDRESSFEPQLVKKYQKIDPKLERQIISLYSQGLSTRSISKQLEEIYGTEVSASFISTVTDQLLPEIAEWQNRPLSEVYPVVFLDALMYKVRADNKVSQKAVYTVLGINLDGEVDVLGLWLAETEGAKFWLSVLNDLKTRGVKDILLACVDGLKGFPEAIEVAFPRTQVQLCVVHQIRNSLKYLSSRDKKLFMLDLKKVYKAPNLKSAETALDELEKRWKGSNPAAVRGWRQNWQELSTYFDYSANIRKMIYTTNAVEGMHRQFRKATKTKGSFSNDDALMKLLYLSITNAKKSLRNKQGWPTILAELKITFEDRIP